MFKELIEAKNKVYKEYEEMRTKVNSFWKKCREVNENIKKEFIKQKLYIPIDKLPEYLKDTDAGELTIVFEDGKTLSLDHDCGIIFENTEIQNGKKFPCKKIKSYPDSHGYCFEFDIDKEHIVGFYDLITNEKVKETFMEEIIKDKE